MSEVIEILRRQYRHVVTSTLAIGARNPLDWQGNVQWTGQEVQLIGLPTDVSALALQQNPATGDFWFMADMDGVDGPAEVA